MGRKTKRRWENECCQLKVWEAREVMLHRAGKFVCVDIYKDNTGKSGIMLKSIIPALGRLRQGCHELKVSLRYLVSPRPAIAAE